MLFYLVGYPKNVLNAVGSFSSSTSSSLHLLISRVILLGILWILYFGLSDNGLHRLRSGSKSPSSSEETVSAIDICG
ncbi:hypothetical protein TNCV_3126991 [Trichonephila clavipes]|nr:hypothetical protein TNCV_3126991 [Trichonephila clavipes]